MNMPPIPFDLPPLPGPQCPSATGQGARRPDPLDISAHEEWFRLYAEQEKAACPHEPDPEDLKYEHTFRVLANARAICLGEGFAAPLCRACLLAALYHDIARFAQYRCWHTFKDQDSCNHGELGARLVEQFGLLEHEPHIARTIIRAIAMHNAYALPEGLPFDVALVTNVVRDADKLDILRVMDEHLSGPGPYSPTVILSLPDDPERFSPKVLDCALHGQVASYRDLTSVNDFRLLLGSWVHALAFASAKGLMASQGHAASLLNQLPDTPFAEVRSKLLADLAALRRDDHKA